MLSSLDRRRSGVDHTQLVVQEAHEAHAALHATAVAQLRSAASGLSEHHKASSDALASLSGAMATLAQLRADADSSVREWTSAAVGLFSGLREHAEEQFAEGGSTDFRAESRQASSAAQRLEAAQESVLDAVLQVGAAVDAAAAQQTQLEVCGHSSGCYTYQRNEPPYTKAPGYSHGDTLNYIMH